MKLLKLKLKGRKSSPYLRIVASFLAIILLGTLLLLLPFATKSNISLDFLDALFMTVSAVCVTGLSTIANLESTFTVFGKAVICILIEIGGLSILTIAIFFFIIFGRKLNMSKRMMMKEALNQNQTEGISKLIKRIIVISLTIQAIGAILNTLILWPHYNNFFQALGVGIFHAISSFNNAGFDIFGTGDSMIGLHDNILLNINTDLLIILGGIGFIVITDFLDKKSLKRLNVHSKIVLISSAILIVFGTLFIKLAMWNQISWFQAFNTSISSRTAGFASFDLEALSNSGLIVIIMLMFIGASPCSTGGGVKTTTFFAIILAIIAFAKGKNPRIGYKSLSNKTIIKAFSLVSISVMYIMLIALVISFTDSNLPLNAILFEVVSAFGTVGLSMGITSSLSVVAKLLICLTMFLGRVGPLTIMSLWNKKWNLETQGEVRYLEEKIIIG